MIQNVLIWLATKLLELAVSFLFEKAEDKISEAKDTAKDAATDAANLKAYQEAKDREERIKRATDLLNGTLG